MTEVEELHKRVAALEKRLHKTRWLIATYIHEYRHKEEADLINFQPLRAIMEYADAALAAIAAAEADTLRQQVAALDVERARSAVSDWLYEWDIHVPSDAWADIDRVLKNATTPTPATDEARCGWRFSDGSQCEKEDGHDVHDRADRPWNRQPTQSRMTTMCGDPNCNCKLHQMRDPA